MFFQAFQMGLLTFLSEMRNLEIEFGRNDNAD